MSITFIRSGFQSLFTTVRGWFSRVIFYDYMALITAHFFLIAVVFSAILGVITAFISPLIALIMASVPLLAVLISGLSSGLQFTPVYILFAAAFLPFYLSTGTMSVAVDSLILTGAFVVLWFLRMMLVEKEIRLKRLPINKPVLGFIVAVPISMIWSVIFRDPLVITWDSFVLVQLAETAVMILLPACMLLVANVVKDLKPLKYMVVLFLLVGVIGYLYETRYNLGLQRLFDAIKLEVKTGGLFTLWLVCMAIGIAIYNEKLAIPVRVLLLSLGGIWVYYRFWQNISWMTGWLPSLCALFVLFYMRSKKLIFLFILLFLVLIVVKYDFFVEAIFAEQMESGTTRLMAWSTNIGLSLKHFVFGTGPGGYAAYYMTYLPDNAMATHNNYLDIFAQTGIVGIGFYLFIFYRLVTIGLRLCKRVRGRSDFVDAMSHAIFAGLVGCIIAMGFGDWMIPFPYTQGIASFDYIVYSWLFLGTLLVLDNLYPSSAAGSRELDA